MMVAHMKYMSLQSSQSSCAMAYSRLERSFTFFGHCRLGLRIKVCHAATKWLRSSGLDCSARYARHIQPTTKEALQALYARAKDLVPGAWS